MLALIAAHFVAAADREREPVPVEPLGEHSFEGVVNNLQRRYRESDSMAVKEELAKFINEKKCPSCDGARLRTEARFVKIGQGAQQRHRGGVDGGVDGA